MLDNTTSCSYINKLGGKTTELDMISRDIWFWCIDRHIHLSAAHVPGKDNCEADEESRIENDDTEWSLTECTFAAIHELYPEMSVDLFASRINKKLDRYVAGRPDPNALAVDDFTMTWNNDFFLYFPPFQLVAKDFTEDRGRQFGSSVDCSSLANPELVAQPIRISDRKVLSSSEPTKDTVSAAQTRKTASAKEDEPWVFSHIRKALKDKGTPKSARDLILKSWRNSTKKQYNTYIAKWFAFCKHKINQIRPSINDELRFLSNLFAKGLQYRSLGTARSALSTFLKLCSNIDINKYEEITRLMKGAFLDRPALPKYSSMWSVDSVLHYIKSLEDLTLLQLSGKLSLLFLLVSAQRCQTLHLIELSYIKITKDKIFIAPTHLLKQSRPNKHLDIMVFKAYDKDSRLCIVKTLTEYIDRTKELRNSQKLLISTIKPHKAASKSTISRWVKMVVIRAGIDPSFGPHSTRAASVSKAKLGGISLETIMKTAGWSSSSMFAKFYDKPVDTQLKTVQDAILDA